MKKVIFEFDSGKQVKKFPYEVKREVGHALNQASVGKKHQKAKVLVGFSGAGVLEIRDQQDGCAYRVFYTTQIEDKICVLHAIKKKSKHGIATPKEEIEVVKQRLKETKLKYKA